MYDLCMSRSRYFSAKERLLGAVLAVKRNFVPSVASWIGMTLAKLYRWPAVNVLRTMFYRKCLIIRIGQGGTQHSCGTHLKTHGNDQKLYIQPRFNTCERARLSVCMNMITKRYGVRRLISLSRLKRLIRPTDARMFPVRSQ
jgi:hypothetical protein